MPLLRMRGAASGDDLKLTVHPPGALDAGRAFLRAHKFHDRDESPAQEQGDQKRIEQVLAHVSAVNPKRRSRQDDVKE